LARVLLLLLLLLLLAHFGKEGKPEPVIPKISQDTLAERIGTTRSRVSFFLNKFRKLGFLGYNGGMHVHSSLLNSVLHDYFRLFLLIFAQGTRHIACLINFSNMSCFDQTSVPPEA
jgi:Crp-like helix-turn-helix domain